MTMSAQTLITGSNASIGAGGMVEVKIDWTKAASDLDVSCFMVGENGKVPSDDYFVFYNQPADPKKHVAFSVIHSTSVQFMINLDELDANINKCVFAATLDGGKTFSTVENCKITITSATNEVVYHLNEGKEETSLVLMELYRYQSQFKVRAIGRGFNGGLKPLAEAHGVTIEDETPQEPPAPAVVVPVIPLTKIDLLKKKVEISLEKKNLVGSKARVAIVIDASGSMSGLFANGTVQRAFEKVLAVAACMDDDGVLDVWFFGSSSMRAPSVTAREFENYVSRVHGTPGSPIGYDNNEPEVMKDVIKKYTIEEPSRTMPTYVLFLSDGGIDKSKAISKLLVESSNQNIFWQFVGLGHANFGILQKLDDLKGRFIDNSDFFALSKLESITDEELYSKMFDEYPGWLKEAKSKGILV